jgi:hypothetical protein
MTQSRQPEDRDILTRVTALEFQMVEIQNSQIQVRATFAPGGYISDGFERVVDRLRSEIQESEERLVNRIDGVEERLRFESQTKHEELTAKIEGLNTKIEGVEERLNAKLDILIRGMTGMGQE